MIDPQALAEDSVIEVKFLQELRANGLADETLINYLKAARTLEPLNKDPAEMEKSDLIEWSGDLRDRYADSTADLYRICVKHYFKWLHTGELDGGEYPDCVDWIKTGNNGRSLPKEILSHEEIKRLAEGARKQRDRAMIWTGYESGCRQGELQGIDIRDVDFDRYGAQIMVDGKTGKRRIRLVESVPDLKLWLSMHPKKDNPDAPLWISMRRNRLTKGAWYMNLQRFTENAGIKKHVYPHLLRHSRATHLAAQGVNEAQMREIFGWTKNSNMPSVYVHLSGRDTDATVLELYGIDVNPSENQLKMGVKVCPFCRHENSPNAKSCNECNAPLDAIVAESSDERLREQDEPTKKIVQKLIDKAPEIVKAVMEEDNISEEMQRLGRAESTA